MTDNTSGTSSGHPAEGDRKFLWYILGMVSWYGSFGLQTVLFPYIVLNELGESAYYVGVAQMCLTLPSLLLIAVGGMVADRVELRGFIIRLHLLAFLPPVVMAAVFIQDGLSYPLVLVFALSMGTLTAFALPSRDALLSHVAGDNMQKGVAGAMGAQFGSQLIGISLAATAGIMGISPLLVIQGFLFAAGAIAVAQLNKAPPHPREEETSRKRELVEGFIEVANSPGIWPFCVLTFAVGIFYIGPFMVGIPVFIRDVFGGQSTELAMSSGAFMLGTILATVVLMRFGGIQKVGRNYVISLTTGFIILYIMGFKLSLPVFIGFIFFWGVGAGVAMTMGRSYLQFTAKPSHRARILAIYAMGFMGGGPIGSFLMGFLIEEFGVYTACQINAAGMVVVVTFVLIKSKIWTTELPASP